MTVPSYTTDLSDITTADTGGSWDEFTGLEAGAQSVGEEDYFIQGSACTTETMPKSGLCSIAFDYTSNITIDSGICVFLWHIYLAPNSTQTFDNGGMRLLIGSDLNNWDGWKVGGSDYAPFPYGGWKNVAVDPTFSPDYTGGAGNLGSYRWFGSGISTTAAMSKGDPHGMDATRYGRGEAIMEYGETDDYCTFAGFAATNDNQSYRWGLFQEVAGGFLWKGLMSLGTISNPVDFRDSNRNIVIDDTPRTYTAFNGIEVTHSDSRVDWTSISFQALGTLSKGKFECIDDADINFDSCAFTDMGTFIFKSNSTINDTTFRRCGQITQGDGVFDGCIFDGSAPLYADDLANIDYCAFTSSGTGHAMELTISGTYTFTGNTFTGYGVSGTLDAALYNNSGGYILLNVGGGGDSPTYRNGAGASTLVQNTVTLTLTDLVANSEVRIYSAGTTTELDGIENCGTEFEYSYNYVASTYVDIVVHHLEYEWFRQKDYPLASTAADLPIAQRKDRWYDNP